ncbi:hypothetical protein [Nocardia sp. NPDC058705]|uniref:hypothetical protein n=1 Tax=Nocardia sp. NPDC058705 TaxID=3346609 RepID=UPI00367D639C
MTTPAPSMLEVLVRTPCVVGTDPVNTHGVDIDTVCDANGIPYIPKNRMSARLRDAALTVLAGPGGGPTAVTSATALFGNAYSVGNTPRLLSVGAAKWPAAATAQVDTTLAALGRRFAQHGLAPVAMVRREITRGLTVEIGQTAIADNGAPLAGSLRFTRGIRPGVLLRAPLSWRENPSADDLRFLALSVLALRQIGHGASDHRGHVTCSLDGDFDATVALAFPQEDQR